MRSSYLAGMAVLGADAGVDIRRVTSALRVRPMSGAMARRFLAQGLFAINFARKNYKEPGALIFTGPPPALTATYDSIENRLKMLQAGIDASSGAIPDGIAKEVTDVTQQAVIEFNKVAQGRADLEKARNEFLNDVIANAAEIPAAVASGAKYVAEKAKEAGQEVAFYGKVTFWAAIGAVGLVGFGAYKALANSDIGIGPVSLRKRR